MDNPLIIANRPLHSRLMLGTARYPNHQTLLAAIDASQTDLVTFSIRRRMAPHSDLSQLISSLKAKNKVILPNTAGCHTAHDAILTAKLAREALETNWIKLEVIGDNETLYPDTQELLKAASVLVNEGFVVLAYCNDDLVVCQKLQDVGCAAIMPLGSPIGSGMGILNPYMIELLRKCIQIPLVLDAGIGSASDVARAMEIGCDAVLINTAIAQAANSESMAKAMRLACEAGRLSYLAGRIPKRSYACPSSPSEGLLAWH
jgi:thiazole synthase